MAVHTDFENFERVMWNDVSDGDEVFLAGTYDGKPVAYGPHSIYSVKNRTIRSGLVVMSDLVFMHYAEDLMKRR